MLTSSTARGHSLIRRSRFLGQPQPPRSRRLPEPVMSAMIAAADAHYHPQALGQPADDP